MTILQANLKHLYQRRSLWFWNILFALAAAGFCIVPLTDSTPEKGEFVLYLIICLPLGIITAGLQQEILTKPFAFCLPRHRTMPRRFIFLVVATVSIILSLVFLAYPGLGFPYVLLVICAAALTAMTVCLLGVLPVMAASQSLDFLGFLPLIVFGIIFFEAHTLLGYLIISSPVPMIIFAGPICTLFWFWLGRDSLARNYSGRLTLGVFDAWSPQKVKKYHQAQDDRRLAQKGKIHFEKMENFFLTTMKKHPFFSNARYEWGNLYIVLTTTLRPWRSHYPISWLLLIVFMGYFGVRDRPMSNLLFFIPVIGLLHSDLLPCRSILLPAGRSEKYYGAAFSAAAMTLITALFPVAMFLASLLFDSFLPDISLKGRTFSYHPMNIRYLYLCLLFAFITLIIATIFPRNNLLRIIFGMALMYLGILLVMMPTGFLKTIGPAVATALVLAGWAASLLILRYHCLRKSLVGQSRQY